jgi:hypothetical protein
LSPALAQAGITELQAVVLNEELLEDICDDQTELTVSESY